MRRTRAWRPYAVPLLGLAVLVAGVAILAVPPDTGEPLDPRSAQPAGTKALLDVLREAGIDAVVTDEVPSPPSQGGPGVALVLRDVTEPGSDSLDAYVEGGGRLVVTDPRSPLATDLVPTGSTDFGVASSTMPRRCEVPALRDAERVLAPRSTVFEVPTGWTGCYRRGSGAWLLTTSRGDGELTVTGGPGFVTNGLVGNADNAVAAVRLLDPGPGGGVAVLDPSVVAVGEGDQTLTELIDPRLRTIARQLAVAFLVLVAWRARRLGKPVREPQEVALAGSEVVTAYGNLLQRGAHRARAAQLVRDDLRRTLAERMGLPPSVGPEAVAETVAARTDLSPRRVLATLDGPDDLTDAQLVELAGDAETIRRAVLAPPREAEPERGALVEH